MFASAGKFICGFLCIWRHLFSESQDIFNLIFGKHAQLSPSWMVNISEFQLSSIFVHRKKFAKKLIFFSPQHANELNIPNILKYASNRINSFIYPNKFYYNYSKFYYIIVLYSRNLSGKFISPK